jgi:hypothetical protein
MPGRQPGKPPASLMERGDPTRGLPSDNDRARRVAGLAEADHAATAALTPPPAVAADLERHQDITAALARLTALPRLNRQAALQSLHTVAAGGIAELLADVVDQLELGDGLDPLLPQRIAAAANRWAEAAGQPQPTPAP